MLSHSMVLNIQKPVACPGCGRIRVSLTCQAGDPVDSPVTWASAPADAAAVARDVSDRADGVSGLVDPALPAHAPTGAVAVARDVSDRADGVSGLVDPALPAHAPTGAVAVARDVSDRADGVSGLVDPALPAHAPTGAVAAGDRRSVKRGSAPRMPGCGITRSARALLMRRRSPTASNPRASTSERPAAGESLG